MLALLMSMAASMASAQAVVNGIYYIFSGTTAEVESGGINYTGDIIIPPTVEYNGTTYNVTDIGDEAFLNCTGLISVTIPEGVTYIGESAFKGCRSLTSITIPNSVTEIEEYALIAAPA